MKPPAILSLIWPKNQRVLWTFSKRYPEITLLVPHGLLSPEADRRIRENGGSVQVVDGLLDDADQQAIAAELAEKQHSIQSALKDRAWSQHWQNFPVPADQLGQILSDVAAVQLPWLLRLLAAVERASAQYDVRLIVLNEDQTLLPRGLVAWGKSRGVPSLHLSHGLELGLPYTVHVGIYADVTAIFGERGYEGYHDVGLDTSSLRITGNPCWDDYAHLRGHRAEIRAQLAGQHGLSPLLPIVVFGTTWSANLTAFCDEGIHGKTLRSFLTAGKELLQSGLAVQLVIKDHPGAPPAAAERLRKLLADLDLPATSVCYVTGDPMGWVLAADVLVSMQSNLGVEALVAGTPAIDLLTETSMWLGPCFAADAGVLEVDDADLAPTLRELLCNEGLRQKQLAAMAQAAPRHNLGIDGRATERVVDLIAQLLAERRTKSG